MQSDSSSCWRYKIAFTYRHVFKEQVAPLILHIEEEPEDESDVHDADEEDHDHPRVDGEPVPPACLGALLSQSHHGQISGNYILRKDNSRKLLEHKKTQVRKLTKSYYIACVTQSDVESLLRIKSWFQYPDILSLLPTYTAKPPSG